MRRHTSQTERQATIVLVGVFGLLALGCENRVGAAACKSLADCAPGESCVEGYCSAEGVPCALDNECGLGAFCRDGFCTDGLDPNVGEGEGEGEPTGSGTVEVAPREVDFGSPALGVGVEQVVRVTNAGGGTFDVVGVAREQGTSEEFTWVTERPFPITLTPGDQLEITLVYTLADGQDDIGRVYVETTAATCAPACDDPSAIAVDLVSEFKGSRNLLVTPPEHDFGYVPPAQESAPRSVLLTNDGSIDKVLTVTSVDVSGDLDQFTFTLPALPLYLSPGQSAEIPVVYAPTVAASGHGLTFVASANSDSPERTSGSAHLVATSQPPNALVFDPPELVFPQLAVGQTAQRTSALKNIGGVPITVSSLVLGPQIPAQYSVAASVQLPYTLLPNASIDVYVDFQAQSGGSSQNNVSALNNQASGDVPVLNLRGDGYVPPGGPNVSMSMGPDGEPLPGCALQASAQQGGHVPAANVDIAYRAPTGAVCGKPQNPSCGLSGGSCSCAAFAGNGNASWTASRVETVRGETWVVDEQVVHEGGGQDGTYRVIANLVDNCIAVPATTDYYTLKETCRWMDCENGPQACFEYWDYPICTSACEGFSSMAISQDCLQRGPARIKTTIRIWGGTTDETRYFCKTLENSGDSSEVVTLNRQGGYFTIASVAPGVVEVGAGQACP